jgi:MFS family permease
MGVALVGCIWRPSLLIYGASLVVLGSAWSIWLLARLTFISDAVPPTMRGRAMSSLGGVNRIGVFIGPFMGAGLMLIVGLDGAFYLHAATGLAAWLVMVRSQPSAAPARPVVPTVGASGFLSLIRTHAKVFLTAGSGALIISALRGARQVLIPLWGNHLGLEPGLIGVVFGLSGAVDLLLVYPAGSVMDRRGRRSVLVPGLGVLSCAVMIVPLVHSTLAYIAASLFLGLGNGLSSGILMTLGADFAPRDAAARFLGIWRLIADLGTAGGPAFIGMMDSVASLSVGAVLIGLVGFGGMALVALTVPETAALSSPTTTRAGSKPLGCND